MRLAKLIIIISLLTTIVKAHNYLPWQNAESLQWQITYNTTANNYNQISSKPLGNILTLCLEPSGIIQITDKRGFIRSRLELPGRPLKAWRDWGISINNLFSPMSFQDEIPIQQDVVNLLMQIADFRVNLEGLLWVIDDSEKILSIINPANSSVSYIPLPGGSNINLIFHPNHIEAVGEILDVTGKTKVSWSLNWLTLLPNLLQPNTKKPNSNIYGTAIVPFPKN